MPVIFLDVTREQSHVLNLALNKISGTWDEQLLAQMLADLSVVPDIQLSLSGFENVEIASFLKHLSGDRRAERCPC